MDTNYDTPDTAPVTCPDWVGRALDDLAVALGESASGPAAAWSPQAETLMAHLRAGSLTAALDLCLTHAPGLARLHLDLFLPILQRLEAEWRDDAISHDVLNFTFFHMHRLIALLGTQRRAQNSNGHFGRVLVAMAPGECHVYGAHVLADVLCDGGWRVDLHEATDTDSLRHRLARTSYVAACLSIGHDAALHGLADTIAAMRAESANPRLRVIVGGAGIESPVSQYQFLGADLVALSVADGLGYIHGLRPDWAGIERTRI